MCHITFLLLICQAVLCVTMSHCHFCLCGPCALAMTSPSLALHSPNSHSGSSSFPAGPILDGVQSMTSCTSISLQYHREIYKKKKGSDLSPLLGFFFLSFWFKADNLKERHYHDKSTDIKRSCSSGCEIWCSFCLSIFHASHLQRLNEKYYKNCRLL